jgi:tRNA pseudouridine55 synthase
MILIDKPNGISSFGVVSVVRRFFSVMTGKKCKVGHTGTLDPFATGLLILLIGDECKEAGNYSKLDKVYETDIRLGQVSSTGDPEGEIKNISDYTPTNDEIKSTVACFVGKIQQTPPIFSAIKINGVRAYKLARNSKEPIVMPKREIEIYDISIKKYEYPIMSIKVHVSSGTYIRSLATDIGEKLGTGAYCQSLRRISVGKWSVNDAEDLNKYRVSAS